MKIDRMMFNKTETEEREYLELVKSKLEDALHKLENRAQQYAVEIREQKQYMWESRGDMDHVEKVSARQSAAQSMASGETVLSAGARIRKLISSPYFGRFDFINSRDSAPLPVYVGIHTFVDKAGGGNLIFDWRAPISTVFYDFELGPAAYNAPSGRIAGDVSMKRQFRIRNGKMAFMLESGLNILDDVLQEELSRASDDKMKNIVATIQRDQNAVIRNEDSEVLVIQGVAGSGKTSIALHRIAFLLYRFKESLTSKDILILSPNKVFADFIADVLPELGEESMAEMEMDRLAESLLENKFKFETFFEQTSRLLEKEDTDLPERIRVKASLDFQKTIDAYITHVEETRFATSDLWINGRLVPDWLVEEAFRKRSDLPLNKRLGWATEMTAQNIWSEYRHEVTAREKREIRDALKKMVRNETLRDTYKGLYTWMGRPELFKPAPRSHLEHADVFPLIYLKMRIEGVVTPYDDIKHLVVDEMQDYTPIQFAVLGRLFRCDKTILGDIHQSVNPFGASSAETVGSVYPASDCVALVKSYRSSYEITEFARGVLPNDALVAVERHGFPPVVIACASSAEETLRIRNEASAFLSSGFHTMGIILKTHQQALKLHKKLEHHFANLHVLTPKSSVFHHGIVISSAHLSKGLEFDQVVVPQVDDKNYADEMDRNLLYIACTRAMHKLTLTFEGAPSKFLPTKDR